MSRPAEQVVLPAPPPLPRQSYTFQVYAGNTEKWVSYEEDVQRQLNELWARGGGETEVTIGDYDYTIRLTTRGAMTQDRVGGHDLLRQVRILELEGP